jgi:hypothetical protein
MTGASRARRMDVLYIYQWCRAASHPSLLCGILYARLEEWDDAVAVAEGFLAIEVKNQDKIS